MEWKVKRKSLNESKHAYVDMKKYDYYVRFLIYRAMVIIDWLCMSSWEWYSWWLYSVLMHVTWWCTEVYWCCTNILVMIHMT